LRLLLVEDDPVLGDGLCTALRNEGYATDWIKDGRQALQALNTEDFALAVLDLGLPGMDGLEVLRRARNDGVATPVLILTARDAVNQRVQGLDLGADDYLAKPFDLDELQARLRCLLRRHHQRAAPLITVGALEIKPATREVCFRGEAVRLSHKEFSVLCYLAENTARIISRTQLEDQLYGWDQAVDSNALEVHIHNLRKKLDNKLIKTIRGAGYQLVPIP